MVNQRLPLDNSAKVICFVDAVAEKQALRPEPRTIAVNAINEILEGWDYSAIWQMLEVLRRVEMGRRIGLDEMREIYIAANRRWYGWEL